MEAFKSKINAVRDILRKDGVTGIDSITHCVAFYILRNLDIELCEKLNIPVKFAYCNFNKDDNEYFKTHPLTWGSVQDDARFIIENVTKDEPTLKSIFPITVEYLLNEYK